MLRFSSLLLALLTLLLGCVTPRAGQVDTGQRDKGFTPSESTAEALDATFRPRRVAVVVGIGSYDDPAFPELKWARKDAEEVSRILADPGYGGFDRVVRLLRPEEGRRDRILAELISLRNDLRRQDTLIVYVSAHGTMSLDASGEPHLYLVASDTRPGDLRGTAVELAEVQSFFSQIRAERKALILDACYNGDAKSTLQPTVRQRIQRMEEEPVLSRKVRLGESEAHLFASTFGRPAREDDALQHGVYTYHLLDALTWNQLEADTNGDGLVTVYEAHDHARRGTISYTTGSQIPEAYFRVVGRNDAVLVGAPEARLEEELGAVYYYGPVGDSFDGATLMVDGREKGSFPGTFTVPPGRHHIRVLGMDGTVLQDRSVRVVAGEALAAEALRSQPVVHNGFVSVGPKLRLSLTDSLHSLVGRAHAGVQVSGGYRFLGPAEGLTLGAGIGYAPHQARFSPSGASPFYLPRHIVWGEVGAGYRHSLGRLELGIGYRLRGEAVSALDDPSCAGHIACDQWFFAVHSLVGEQVLRLGGRWSLLIEEELGVSALDPDGNGTQPVLDAGFRIGVQVGL
ncbi:MAG: caspase family protein [Myxococcota bacterium]|nr:caspase family protein [Myxococcota bacterium]